jgi:methionyl aminopeptidase
MMTRVKTAKEIQAMRESGKMLATILQLLKNRLEVGMSTKDLANLAATELRKLGGHPTFLGFQGFPDVLCVSVNEEVVHGIPKGSKIIHKGDIVSLDFGVTYNGMVTDAAISCIAGEGRKEDQALVEVTKESLEAGILTVHDGVWTGDIGSAVAEILVKHNYGIVRDLVGHGVGHHLHEDPNVPNYGRKGTGTRLQSGMTIAIEPMATMGDYEVYTADDGWTIITADHSRSAHFEHSVAITDSGVEVLTDL